MKNGWASEGLFEPQLTHIRGDYLLQREHIHVASSLQPADLKTIKAEISSGGQQTFKDLVADGETPIHIPTPRELSDSTLQLSSSQYEKMKYVRLQREEILRTYSSVVNMANDLLESDEILPSEGRAISPPLHSRRIGRGCSESWSRMTKEVVSSVIDSLQEEENRQSSPTLSNDTWNNIDSCLRPSCTPPSSQSPQESKEPVKQVSVDFLSPSADPNTWGSFEGLENPFEAVLFSRTDGIPNSRLDRSISFNPRKHWNMTSCLFDEPHQPVKNPSSREPAFEGENYDENQDSLEILNQLVKNKGWDDQQFQREIFGSPADVGNLHSRLKRIPVEVPDSSLRENEINAELLPPCLHDFRLPEPDKAGSRKPSLISQGVQKVEGLRALNIELPWNAYTFQPSATIEELTDLDAKPVHEVPASDDNSSTKDGYSFISKRFKSEHNSHSADQPWFEVGDFLDQSSCGNDSHFSRLSWDGSNHSGTAREGHVSTSEVTNKRSTGPATRPEQDLQTESETEQSGAEVSETEKSSEPESNNSPPLRAEYQHPHHLQEHEMQSEFSGSDHRSLSPDPHSSFEEHADRTEDDKVLQLLGLRTHNILDSSADFKNRDFYSIWTSSEP